MSQVLDKGGATHLDPRSCQRGQKVPSEKAMVSFVQLCPTMSCLIFRLLWYLGIRTHFCPIKAPLKAQIEAQWAQVSEAALLCRSVKNLAVAYKLPPVCRNANYPRFIIFDQIMNISDRHKKISIVRSAQFIRISWFWIWCGWVFLRLEILCGSVFVVQPILQFVCS